MSDPVYDELVRLSLRREFSADDQMRVQAYLAAHPQLREQWEEDRAVGRAISDLKDVPLSSNFTSRVLHEIDAEDRRMEQQVRRPVHWWRWTEFFKPRLSWAAIVVLVAGLAIYQQRIAKRHQMARDVGVVAQGLAALPHPELLRDFDAINQLRHVSTVSDDELLTALQ